VYGNLIRHNVARGDGLAGITIHEHLVGDLNGNVIKGNLISNDNLDGDFDFAAAAASETTGVDPASTQIIHNHFGSDVTMPVSTN
jgi:hypothetical protein